MTKLTPPNWAKDAVPTTRGWTTADGKELLISRRHTQEDVDAFNGKSKKKKPTLTAAEKKAKAEEKKAKAEEKKAKLKAEREAAVEAAKTEAKKLEEEATVEDDTKVMLHEAPVSGKGLENMTEEQLEALNETNGTSGETLTE